MAARAGVWAAALVWGLGLAGAGCSDERGDVSSTRPTPERVETLAASPDAESIVADARATFGRALPARAGRGYFASAGRLQPQVKGAPALRVSLGRRASDAIELRPEGAAFATHVALQGALETEGRLASGYIVYERALRGEADVLARADANGVEDYVLFRRPAKVRELRYSVAMGRSIAGLRLVSNALELVDASGAPRLRMEAPWAVDAEGKRADLHVSVADCAIDTNPAAPWGRAAVAPGKDACTVSLTWEADLRYPLLVDPAWTSTGSMSAGRAQATATVLANGRVLVAGGSALVGASLTSAELYDPSTGTWATTGALNAGRSDLAATRIAGGFVLLAGGWSGTAPLASVELYDPNAGTFAMGTAMGAARYGHSAHVLPNGRVLVVGGISAVTPSTVVEASTEIYDPAGAGSWSAGPTMTTAREAHGSTVLLDGRILVVGGWNTAGDVASAELLDPSATTPAWAGAGALTTARQEPTATTLTDGRVLVVGGNTAATTSLASTEIFTPTGGGSWAAGPSLANARFGHTAHALSDGRVVVIGGYSSGATAAIAQNEIYSTTNGWAVAGNLVTARADHSAAKLDDSRVLIAGGFDDDGTTSTLYASAELTLPVDLTTNQATYGTSDPIQVTFAGIPASGADWITLAREGSPLGDYVRYQYALTPTGTLNFTPLPVGTYRVRAFYNNGYTLLGQSATTFTVTGAGPTVTTSAPTYTTTDPIVVNWTGLAGTTTDWISLAEASMPASVIRWAYTGGATSGTMSFPALGPGTYVARSYNANSYVVEAESPPFTVSGTVSTTLTTDRTSYTATDSAIVTFSGMLGTSTDWISIAPSGSPTSTVLRWVYTGGTTSGSVSMSLAGLGEGSFVARAYFANGTTMQAQSAPFAIGAPTVTTNLASYQTTDSIVVSWANLAGTSTDWIAIAPAGSPVTTVLRWVYTGGLVSGQTTFAPFPPGSYVARAYYNNDYTLRAESPVFTVAGGGATSVSTNKLSYTNAESVVITFTNMAGTTLDWLSIAPAGSPATDVTRWVYTGGGVGGSQSIALTGVPAGSYVARAYFNNDYTLRAESTPAFTVGP